MLLTRGHTLRTTDVTCGRRAVLADINVGVVVDVVRGPWTLYAPGGRGPCSGGSDPDPGARQLDEGGDAVWTWHPEALAPGRAGAVSICGHWALPPGVPRTLRTTSMCPFSFLALPCPILHDPHKPPYTHPSVGFEDGEKDKSPLQDPLMVFLSGWRKFWQWGYAQMWGSLTR